MPSPASCSYNLFLLLPRNTTGLSFSLSTPLGPTISPCSTKSFYCLEAMSSTPDLARIASSGSLSEGGKSVEVSIHSISSSISLRSTIGTQTWRLNPRSESISLSEHGANHLDPSLPASLPRPLRLHKLLGQHSLQPGRRERWKKLKQRTQDDPDCCLRRLSF